MTPTVQAHVAQQRRSELYDKIAEQAERHGWESEPDHEVGDLQDALSAALDLLTADQLERLPAVLADRRLEGWEDGEPDRLPEGWKGEGFK